MTQRHARWIPRKSTSTTGIKNIITSLPFWIELRQADSFEHWLLMYLFRNLFWIIF